MEINAQHEIFMEQFVSHGDHRKAAEEAGFDRSRGRALFTKYRERIQKMLEDELAMSQVNAIRVLKDSMGDGATNAKQDIRVRSAESVLDRAGLGKKQTMEIGGSALPAVMILPVKDPAPPSKD
jgi:hypothetical protein